MAREDIDTFRIYELNGDLLYENDFHNNQYGVPITKNKYLYSVLKSFNHNSISLVTKLNNNYKDITVNKNMLLFQKNAINDELKKNNIQQSDIEKFTNIIDKCLKSSTEKNILYCGIPIVEENYRIQQLLHTKMNEFP